MSLTTVEQEKIQRFYTGLAFETQKQIIERFHSPRKRVIVLGGPTGCGKTSFAIMLAEALGGEIISADSMQVYRGMDIGTAKPTAEQRARVPHHMIDIRDINESFNVVDFYYEARQCCQRVIENDAIPIVVGGAGFYLHALIYGPPSGPPPLPELRKTLEEELDKIGVEAMYERLREQDPHYAATVGNHDRQKILRGLEIILLTGKKVSRLSWRERAKPLTYDFRNWFLYRSREVLYKRIEKRCDKMLEEGFLEEVIRLEQEGLRQNPSASQAIGYRQALDYLASPRTEKDYQHFVKIFKQASRNYAKRQETWFRPDRNPEFHHLNLELHDEEVLIDIICQDYYQAR